MKNGNSSRPHFRRKKRRKGDTGQLAAQLAPLEEQNKPAAESQIGASLDATDNHADRRFGDIIVDNEDLKVPANIIETQGKHFLGIEPVVLVVLILMLTFIVFIAWQISRMPAP